MELQGYSGTSLAKKLGIRQGFKVRLIDAPKNYFELFTDFPGNLLLVTETQTKKDFIHYFVKDVDELRSNISVLKGEIVPNGMIWISWPKKSSGIKANIDEDAIRNLAITNGLVDIKVCAIDQTWSALKLVIPVKNR
jgi:hypothetical protein